MAQRRLRANLMGVGPNAGQIDNWNEASGRVWSEEQAGLDRQLAPLGRAAMRALRLRPGERILDIGCGTGATSLELGDAVAPDGEVLGVDISRPMLAVAEHRQRDAARIQFLEADAQLWPFAPRSFDAVFSRFGVMFFSDPTAAFANIGKALKPAGRLAFVCWRAAAENPILTAPLAAAAALLPPTPQLAPGAPGPFAFADPEHVRGILGAAGFADIELTPHDEKIGSGDLETALRLTQKIGPLGALLRDNPGPRDAVIAAVRKVLAAHDGPDGVKLDSATWIVTARAPD